MNILGIDFEEWFHPQLIQIFQFYLKYLLGVFIPNKID